MAFETCVTATYRLHCDRCGKSPGQSYHATIADAIAIGKMAGFVDAGYTEGECVHQAWLCKKCAKEKKQS